MVRKITGFRALLVVLLVAIAGLLPGAANHVTAAKPNDGLEIGMPIHDLPYTVKIARAGDAYRAVLIDNSITKAQTPLKSLPLSVRAVQTNTTVGLDANLSKLTVPITYLVFDFEGWDYSSAWEHANPVAAVKLASQIAKAHGLKFILMTTNSYTKNYGAQMAPYVDIFMPQAKGIMANNTPTQYAAEVRPIWAPLKKANPNLKLWLDMAPCPKGVVFSPAKMQSYLEVVRDMIDGVWITYTPKYTNITENYINTYWTR